MESRRGISDAAALRLLGGVNKKETIGRLEINHLVSGDIVALKYSRLYENGVAYWFGITPSAMKVYKQKAVTHFVFILGYEGIVKVPIGVMYEYIQNADTSLQKGGSIKHYHVRFEFDDQILLYNTVSIYNLDLYHIYHEDIVASEISSKSRADLLKEAKEFGIMRYNMLKARRGAELEKKAEPKRTELPV